MIQFTILGQCYSLKNTRTPIQYKGRVIFVPNAKAKAFEREFKKQLPSQAQQHIETPVHVSIEIFYPSNLQDLDEALVLDLMQKFGVIENDRQVVSKTVLKRIDPGCPRVVVSVEPITWERGGRQSQLAGVAR